jgi:hypothetical protein
MLGTGTARFIISIGFIDDLSATSGAAALAGTAARRQIAAPATKWPSDSVTPSVWPWGE